MAQKKGIEVNVDLADGVIRTVGVVVHDPDLQRLILELEVVHLEPNGKDDDPLTPDMDGTHLNQSEFQAGFKLFL